MNAMHLTLIKEFLIHKGASVTEGKQEFMVQLTEELDRKYMNRPYYWHYRDATFQKGEPARVFISMNSTEDPPSVDKITHSHPVFQSLVQSAHEEAGFYKFYEKPAVQHVHVKLYPWLFFHGESEFTPPGPESLWTIQAMSLTTGTLQSQDDIPFNDNLSGLIPENCTLSIPVISFEHAISRLITHTEMAIRNKINTERLEESKSYDVRMHTPSAGIIYRLVP